MEACRTGRVERWVTHVGLDRFHFGERPGASHLADVLRITSCHVDDRRVHFEPLAVGFLKAALAAFAEDEGELVARAADVGRARAVSGVARGVVAAQNMTRH